MGDSPAKTFSLIEFGLEAASPFRPRVHAREKRGWRKNSARAKSDEAKAVEASSKAAPKADDSACGRIAENLLFTYVLAGVGFSCLIGWELSATFSPSLALLSFCTIEEALLLRIVSVLALAATFAFCVLKADWTFRHRNRFFTFGSLLALLAVLNAAANLTFANLPIALSVVVWALFGFSQGSMMMYWCVLFSLLPSRGTAATIGLGAVCGTFLFVLVNSGGTPAISLAGIAALIMVSAGLAAFLAARSSSVRTVSPDSFIRSALLSRSGIFSAVAQGVVYGFMSIELCFMGPETAILGGASGLFGTVLALTWGLIGSRVEITIGVVQRISLPLLTASLLLFPLFGDEGRILCGCIANTTLAHSSVVSWYTTSIDNSEFGLHPVDRFALRQLPTWVGFFAGTIVAYLVLMLFNLQGTTLYLTMTLLALLMVASFCLYSGDDSETKRRLDALLNPLPAVEALRATQGEPEPCAQSAGQENIVEEWQDNFNQRCKNAALRYKLTPRETEVFYLLARGRNAEYIAAAFMVSPATVKSHIYHIYQKLGINSQQHLMNIVDESAGADKS